MTTTNPPNYRQPHAFDPVHNGADECECGLVRDAGIHPPSSPPPASGITKQPNTRPAANERKKGGEDGSSN